MSWFSWPFARGAFTFLGVVSRSSGERARLHLGLAVAASFRRGSYPKPGSCASRVLNIEEKGARASWRTRGLEANCGFTRTHIAMPSPHNMSANSDAQVRQAAPRPLLGRRLPSRYMAWARSQIAGTASASVARQAVRCAHWPIPRATGRDECCWSAGELVRASVLASKGLSFSAETEAYTGALRRV